MIYISYYCYLLLQVIYTIFVYRYINIYIRTYPYLCYNLWDGRKETCKCLSYIETHLITLTNLKHIKVLDIIHTTQLVIIIPWHINIYMSYRFELGKHNDSEQLTCLIPI